MKPPIANLICRSVIRSVVCRGLWAVCFLAGLTAPGQCLGQEPDRQPSGDPPADVLFETHIRPLLVAKCGKCHDAERKKGGLDATTLAALRRGGESGEPAIADSLDESLLWGMLAAGEMPPEGQPQLSAAERSLVRDWIRAGAPARQEPVTQVTQNDVLPFLYARCVVCHGRQRQAGGLDLRSVAAILKGGDSGPAVVPGKPQESLLLQRIHAKDMPPPKELIRAGVRPMEPPEIALLTQWIAQGARHVDVAPDVQSTQPDPLVTTEDRRFWAFQPPVKPPVPSGRDSAPIDAFLLRQLARQELGFSPQADRRTLIRRVAFDLTGLPPQWSDVQRFLTDPGEDWYRRMVDFYLDSPRYGERWGRHWLDLTGYADSEGKRSADPVRQHAWRYRDYVIRSLNDDKPYDQFLIEQLAGDELHDFERAAEITPEMMDALVATGFLRMAPDGTGSDIVDTVEERFEVVADEIEVLGSAVMGLTLRCAQCHSHKYDPIPQRDYYRLVAVFQGAYDVYDWLKPTSVANQSKQENPTRRFLPHVTPEIRAAWQQQEQAVEQQVTALKAALRAQFQAAREASEAAALQQLPASIREDVRRAWEAPAERRTEVQAYLAKKFKPLLSFNDTQLKKQDPDLPKLEQETDKQIKQLRAQLPPEPMIRALWDRGEPSPTWVFRRGQFSNPGTLVGPGVPSVLTDGKTPFEPATQRPGTTGRRLALARWLTRPDHPLTARVLVNRVWYHHFGRGIVESLANFGTTGTPPSHPELLDWLAVSFAEHGWSLKWLHREILTSRAYRQSSQVTAEHAQRDPENRWISRMPLRRLEAESVRDSLLAVAGRLDERQFGPPDQVVVRQDGLVTSQPGAAGWRRTVYVQQRRKEIPTILETFDLPQMIPNCVQRPRSLVAPQALLLLNNGMVRELAEQFAARVAGQVPGDWPQQVDRVYQVALGREPTAAERDAAVESLRQLEKQWRAALASAAASTEAAGTEAAVTEAVGTEAVGTEAVSTVAGNSTGGAGAGADAAARRKALANFCHVIMNSAEFLFVD